MEDLKARIANLDNWWWQQQKFSFSQKVRLERVWQMEQTWQQSVVGQKGRKRAQREERIRKKEVENDWKKNFTKGQTWGKLKKIKK